AALPAGFTLGGAAGSASLAGSSAFGTGAATEREGRREEAAGAEASTRPAKAPSSLMTLEVFAGLAPGVSPARGRRAAVLMYLAGFSRNSSRQPVQQTGYETPS